jgi:hypothetical protein
VRRFAAQKLLAELPTGRFTEGLYDRIYEYAPGVIDRTYLKPLNIPGGQAKARQFVDVAPVEGQRLAVQISPVASIIPSSERSARAGGVYPVTQEIDQLLNNPPRRMANISFGWTDPTSPIGRLSYDIRSTQEPAGPKIKEALSDLLGTTGMSTGDIVMNEPIGLMEGDYKRALTYMQHGFGPPSNYGIQAARIGSQGALTPQLFTNVHSDLARKLNWNYDDPAAVAKRASIKEVKSFIQDGTLPPPPGNVPVEIYAELISSNQREDWLDAALSLNQSYARAR